MVNNLWTSKYYEIAFWNTSLLNEWFYVLISCFDTVIREPKRPYFYSKSQCQNGPNRHFFGICIRLPLSPKLSVKHFVLTNLNTSLMGLKTSLNAQNLELKCIMCPNLQSSFQHYFRVVGGLNFDASLWKYQWRLFISRYLAYNKFSRY